jgi:hypothetical protein
MTARERLEGYLNALRSRLRAHIYVRAGAIAAVGVLAITCLAVWLLNREGYAPIITLSGRAAIITLLMLVPVALLWFPLRRLNRDRGAETFERLLPEQSGRVRTYLDQQRSEAAGHGSVLIDLLAEDAANIAERTPASEIVPARKTSLGAAAAVLAAATLALLLTLGPAYWGFGSRHLLLGAELPRNAVPVRGVQVTPGDVTVRRNSDLSIRAVVQGFDPRQADVYVRFADQQQWERAPMQAVASEDRSQFEFRLYAVRGSLQYYVDADGTRSAEHNVAVVDLPRIERVRLTYNYPDWTGLEAKQDEDSRDIKAVAGTNVQVEIFADAPLDQPALIVDGKAGDLVQAGRTSTGSIAVEQPGRYQIGARVADEFVALSDEYEIEIVPDLKPEIEIQKPGRDWRATSIEEVPVRIQAQDDFRLRDVELRYSVNGGDWQKVRVSGGVKESDSESLLRLEDIGAEHAASEQRLVPGDLVSYYAVAKDRRQSVQTDLFMVQVQPFERRYTQAQAGGGGGGMADEQGAISERQKEILLATWNLQRNDERNARSRRQLEDSADMLAELQATLAQQARTLAMRTRARASMDEDERVKTFVESLERAAASMDPAAKHLSEFKLQEAVPVEQQALQQLLRAEAAFREVQVSMQQNDPSGNGAQSARNFAEMFELEMDLEKSQYESESQLSMQTAQQDLDEAIRKLKELAERQERLAQEQSAAARTQEQRWRQEQLRREAEDLRRRLAELNRQQQSARDSSQARQGSQSSQSSQGQSRGEKSEGSASSDSSGQSQPDTRVANALESVQRALQEMESANTASGSDSQQQQESAREASRNLQRAMKQMRQPAVSGLDEALNQFAERTREMENEQRRIENDLYNALARASEAPSPGTRGGIDPRVAQQLVQSKQKLAEDLTDLQRDMRNAVHEHRNRTPESTQRLSEIVRDVEGSDVMYRLNRSAAEIYYGRAREAAVREGLITEAFEDLEADLREAAGQATKEAQRRPDGATPDALLAEIGELRRALQEGQRGDGEAAGSERGEGAQQVGSNESQEGSPQSGRRPGQQGGPDGERGLKGLAAWNSLTVTPPAREISAGTGSLAEQTAAIGQRVRDLVSRMNRGRLTQAEFDALRRSANQLRRLAGDPMADQTETMLRLIDQIELTALAASNRAERTTPAHATLPDPETPEYRDSVAEYYRRLGDREPERR